MRHALLLICLALAQGCIAPATSDVAANHASRLLDATSSPTSSSSASDVCDNLNNCRSLVSIVTSCIATVFACLLTLVHPNVPGPKQTWISKQTESLKIIVVTLLVPEWVLAWAVRQAAQAWHYTRMLETARVEAAEAANIQHNQNSTHEGHATRSSSRSSSRDQERDQGAEMRLEAMSTLRDNSSGDSAGSVSEAARGEPDEERTNLHHRKSHERSTQVPQEPTHKYGNSWEVEEDLGRTTQAWTTTHGFLASMGGFHYYQGEEPMFPLEVEGGAGRVDRANEDHYLLSLVKSRSLVPPTSEELLDKSKLNALSKATAISQTLSFVTQYFGRHYENLAITSLEIMTLAYILMTCAMYIAWWGKPFNVHCPIRVQGDKEFVRNTRPFKRSDIIHYVTGNQDLLIALGGEERVPTFWAGCSTNPRHAARIVLYANAVGLMAMVVFGALCCTAWSYAFPSLAEKLMWRVCALAITVIPVPMAVVFLVFDPFRATARSDRSAYLHQLCTILCVLLFILARIFLLVISFTTLRHLPPSAYQSVPWAIFLPHI